MFERLHFYCHSTPVQCGLHWLLRGTTKGCHRQFFLSFFLIPTSINLWTFAPRVRATLRHNNSGSIRVTWCFSCINISSLRHLISFSIIYSLVEGNSVLTKMSISALLCLSVCTFLSFLFHTFTWKRSHFNHILTSLFLKRERRLCAFVCLSYSPSHIFNHSLYEGQERSLSVCFRLYWLSVHMPFFYTCAVMLSSSVLSEVQVVIAAIRFLLWCHLAEKGFRVAKAGRRVPQWEWSNKDGGHSISSEKHLSLSLSVCLCVFLSVFKKIHTSFHQGQVTFHSQLLSLSSLPSLADTLTNSTLIPPQAIYFPLKYMETRENTEKK